jgi:RHS repeat-associated protein
MRLWLFILIGLFAVSAPAKPCERNDLPLDTGIGNRTNRTSSIAGIANQSPVYNANDWMTGSDQYDNNGNTTNSASNAYQYDVLNQLTNVNNGQILITYDGDGNRISKKVGGTTMYYLVDDRNPSGYAQVLEEWTSTGTPALSRVYNYGMALISQRQVSGGTVSYYGADGHGSTRFLLNTSGGITDTYTFDAYGLLTASSGSTPNNYLYCGQQFDTDLGFYYQRARYYKTDSGRFWTMDSYEGDNEDPLSLHKYMYCQANPVNMDDPFGNAGESDATATGKAVEKIIKADFRKNCRGIGVAGPAVLTILKNLGTVGRLSRAINVLFPDLVDIKNKEIFEIKPANIRQEIAGAAQLVLYLDELNTLDPKGGWHLGDATDYVPPLAFPIVMPPNEIVVTPPVFGLITYTTLGQFVEKKAENVAEEESADMEDSIGIGTLDASLGAF